MVYQMTLHYDDDDYQAVIFAEDSFRAEHIWEAIGERYELMPEGWLDSECDTWRTVGLVRHEREACVRRIEGVGIYSSRTGWTILPIDYDTIGIEPPG